MKKILFAALIGVFALGIVGLAEATMVSFANPFSGFDSTGWHTNDNTYDLLGVTSFSILGGMGTVYGYLGSSANDISQRGTRGIGVYAGAEGSLDEIDSGTIGSPERIEILFTKPHTIHYLELRSLFDPDEETLIEQGDVYYYLGGSLVGESHLQGTTPRGSGIGLEFTNPNLVVDKMVFQVDTGEAYTDISDFAIAKFKAVAIPEPTSMMLLGMGILGLFGLKRKS